MAALEDLLKSIQSELELPRRDHNAQLSALKMALEVYERALGEAQIAKYCEDHSIRKPVLSAPSPKDAARALLEKVEGLPELEHALLAQRNLEAADAFEAEKDEFDEVVTLPAVEESEISKQFRLKFPELTSAAEIGKMLIFGAFAGRTKKLPGVLAESGEWIDTSGDGTRTVSSAVKRIRDGKVFAVIICEQAIAHQHADPVVASARNQKIPLAYAGKGGAAALARALESLEERLRG